MPARQSSLTANQVSDITRRLSRSDATTAFIKFVNSYLEMNYTHGEEIEKHDLKVSQALKKIENSCKELADIFAGPYPVADEPLTFNQYIANLIWPLHGDEYRHVNDYVDFHALVEPLRRISENANRVRQKHPQKSRANLRAFLKNLVFSFRSSYGRSPVLSDNSNDFIALSIICDAYGWRSADKLKLLKNVVAAQNKSAGSLKKGKKQG